MAVVEVACVGCGETFEAKTPRARWCTTTCRQRAARARRAVENNQAENAKSGTDKEHDLVRAVRQTLTKAGALMTVNGQLALQLARRAANPEESGLVALSKELDARMSAALGQTKPDPGGAGADSDGRTEGEAEAEEDEVTQARRQREDARKAAGLA